MKKVILLLTSLLCTTSVFAQMAFRQLGTSVEFGTTGLGVNVSVPVITDRLIVTVGYNFPKFSVSSDFKLNSNAISNQMNQALSKIDGYNRYIDSNPEVASYLQLSKIPTDNLQKSIGEVKTDIEAKLNFGNFKAFVEYYPTKKSFFHITAGVIISNGEWMEISGKADNSVWAAYKDVVNAHDQLQRIVESHPQLQGEVTTIPSVREAAKVTINNESFAVDPETGKLNLSLSVKKIKPYIGVGFGSSVPTLKRLGFQMEVGAYYQGKPSFDSDSRVAYDANAYSDKTVDDIVDMLQYLRWYPQLSFRFTGRIF